MRVVRVRGRETGGRHHDVGPKEQVGSSNTHPRVGGDDGTLSSHSLTDRDPLILLSSS